VAHALPRTNPDPGSPAGPDATAVVPAGAVIRAVPSARPEADAPPAVEAPAPSPAPADPPATAEPATRGRRGRKTAGGPGARELRRQETRAKIVDAAAELFAERGFDAVSVMEIARRAGVVEKTVFNHFPVKEGLVFDADPPMRAALLEAVRRRPAGESVSAAAGSFVVGAVSLLGSPEAATGLAQMARVIRGSRTLQVREREILGELTNALAQLIAEETGAQGDQVEPWLAAHAVLGLYASLLELARDRVLAGVGGLELSAELRRQGRRGLSLLQFGLAGYAKRR
jgi:AcrR family transcriptional regulator